MLHVRPSIYGTVSAILFLGLGVLHGMRAYNQWELTFNTWAVPVWLSWLIALIGFLMALTAVRSLR